MNTPCSAGSPTTAIEPSATLFLVPRALDRLDDGRRLALSRIGGRPADASLALRGGHPDVLELTPPEKKERIGIDQVREVIRLAQFSPVQAKRKVCLIPRAEALTPEAANALLKILEEPPRNVAFVLLAEHPSDLLPTVVSRCRTIRVPPATLDDAIRRLREAGYGDADASSLVRIPFRDGDLDRWTETRIDVPAARETARRELRGGSIVDLVGAALGDDPIRRYEALDDLIARIDAGDPGLLTVGVRTLAAQDRQDLERFLQELLAVCFERVRSSLNAGRGDVTSSLALCAAIDRGHRSIATYGPPEAVLLSMMLPPGDDGIGG